MMRSMFSGVSGLRNHQTQMDVIGNNISNVNTTGYKASRVNFRDLFSQTLQAATAPAQDGSRGGTNPVQVGLGMAIASIDTLHTISGIQPTGYTTDLALEGSGFFVVASGQQKYYTRAGLFDVDEQGTLVMKGTGYLVQGWMAENDQINTTVAPGSIRIPFGDTIPGQATSELYLGGNLDVNSTSPVVVMATVLDSLGRAHRLELTFTRDATNNPNVWNWQATDGSFTGSGTVTFNSDGSFFDSTGGSVTYSPTGSPTGADPLRITLDFSMMTQFAQPTTAEPTGHNGRAAGTLETFTIDANGIIQGVFSNGLTRNLGQIAVAVFNNPGGLEKVGNTLFRETVNSGEARIGAPGTGARGTIASGALEMSNVDLAQEFTNMIISQRGFQANSRVITTSDEMLQELVNLKR